MPKIIKIKETTSTNKYLEELQRQEKQEEGSVVVAEFQTAGKGQAGNSWESEQGKNLLCSMLLYPDFLEVEKQFLVSEIISLAIVDTLAKALEAGGDTSRTSVSIKWPNDIYYQNKKIVGILIENNILGNAIESCIIGMGVNVNQEKFTANALNPVSLKQITGKEYSLDELLKSLMNNIFTRYVQLMNGEEDKIHSDYMQNLFRNNGFHLFRTEGKDFFAKIKNVSYSGLLTLETKEGEDKVFAFKEVEFRPPTTPLKERG
jgi:BirA family biotin operon repressor/biotin-[acetyl-CoA-carboxylase] ligase